MCCFTLKERIQLIADTEDNFDLTFDLIDDIKKSIGDDMNVYKVCMEQLRNLLRNADRGSKFYSACFKIILFLKQDISSIVNSRSIKLYRRAIGHTDKEMEWEYWQPEVNIYMYEDGVVIAEDINFTKLYYSLEEFEADEWTILREEELIKVDPDLMAIFIDDDMYESAEEIYNDAIEYIRTEDDIREFMFVLLNEFKRNMRYYYAEDYEYYRDKADLIAEAYNMLDELLKQAE